MGVLSKYHRYREQGEAANVNNVERFGEPRVSYFTSSKVFSLHHRINIVDNSDQIVYQANSKAISLHDRTWIYDCNGTEVAAITRKFFSLHERHFVAMADGTQFQISNELWHIVKDVTNIEGLGWQLRGNIAELNFELYDANDRIIAVIGQKMFSLHDKYCIDIYQTEYEQIIIAILVTLQHMIIDRKTASVSTSSSGSD